jgi:transposase-like protein
MRLKTNEEKIVRRRYNEEFKREAVLMQEASGKSCREICQLLEISCEGLLYHWSLKYGTKKRSVSGIKTVRKESFMAKSSDDMLIKMANSGEFTAVRIVKSDESAREEKAELLRLKSENKRLKQALSNHAVKEFLAELREESWREISSAEAVAEVDKRVSKKL